MKGFTVIEIMVSVFIMTILVIAVFTVLNTTSLTHDTDMGLLRLQQEARSVMFTMVRQLREASNISITVIDANNDEISFNTPSQTGLRYYRDRNDLNADGLTAQVMREFPSGTRKILANDIALLKFSLTGSVLEIRLAANKTVRGRQLCFPVPCENPVRALKEKVTLRN